MEMSNSMKPVFKNLLKACFILLSSYMFVTCQYSKKQPKNIILMISDGWGYNHILATDYYQYGNTNVQSYQAFPYHAAMSTFMAEGGYDPDSAWVTIMVLLVLIQKEINWKILYNVQKSSANQPE